MMSDLEAAKRVADIHTGEHAVIQLAPRQTWAALVAATDELLADLERRP